MDCFSEDHLMFGLESCDVAMLLALHKALSKPEEMSREERDAYAQQIQSTLENCATIKTK